MRAAVLGATGFVGSALVPALARATPTSSPSRGGRRGEPGQRRSGRGRRHGCDVAARSARGRRRRLLPRPLARLDRLRRARPPRGRERRRARPNAPACSRSSISAASATTARPLRAPAQPRRHGAALAAGAVPVTTLRAAVVVGRGSAGFETIVALVDRLPAMVAPRWSRRRRSRSRSPTSSATSRASRAIPEALGASFDVGGPEVLTYGEMIERIARLRGRRPLILEVPILSPRLSSYWLHLVTPVRAGVARRSSRGCATRRSRTTSASASCSPSR